jgi:hypothetical protein
VSTGDYSDHQAFVDEIGSMIMEPKPEKAQANGHGKASSASATLPTDEAVLRKCRDAGNAQKFIALYDFGDLSGYGGDDSRADLALARILGFWTQDAWQVERLISGSALGQREKWRRRRDYRERTIRRALDGLTETYQWPTDQGVTGVTDYIGSDSSDTLEVVRFARLDPPPPREFVMPGLVPRSYPTTLFGWGGTAKSLLAALLAMSVAGGRPKFLGRDVTVHGPTLFVDFELDGVEQHRRILQLAAGLKMEVPDDFLYVSALGAHTPDAIKFALALCKKHDVVLVVLDSLGKALVGDMLAAKDVIGFHNTFIAPFQNQGVTPVLVDHQARQQPGEGYQSKGAYGSAYKEHLSRSLIQVEAGDRSAEQGVLNVRLRHKKSNFAPLEEPFDVALTFSDDVIVATTRELTAQDKAQEQTLNGTDRVLAALEDGPLFPDEIADVTGLKLGTVKNKLVALKKAGRVVSTGQIRNQSEQVSLVSLIYKGSDTYESVANFFQDPPDWLPGQLEKYRERPELHFRSLCMTVAAKVLDNGDRWEEVKEEVERELAKLEAGGVTRVTNIDEGEPYEVYVGRGKRRAGLKKSKWHNPYVVDKHGTRKECVEWYERDFRAGDLGVGWDDLPEIRGKVLGCHCKPKPCHGDVLVRLVEEGTQG